MIERNKYIIDYQFGIAYLYTSSDEWEERFYHLAKQCFGIRKSIGKLELIRIERDNITNPLENEYERLEHNRDVIVWDKEGKKIKSEFD